MSSKTNSTSHELRTPLNAIVGWVRLLKAGALEDPAQRQRAIEVIDNNIKVQMLVDDLHDVSRMVQGRISLTVGPADLRSIVAASVDTIRPAAIAKRIALHLDDGGDVRWPAALTLGAGRPPERCYALGDSLMPHSFILLSSVL